MVEQIFLIFKLLLTKIKLVMGWVMVGLGIPVFFLPIPFGLIMIVSGLLLVFSASPPARRYVVRKAEKHPFLRRRLLPMLQPKAKPAACPKKR